MSGKLTICGSNKGHDPVKVKHYVSLISIEEELTRSPESIFPRSNGIIFFLHYTV